MSCARNIFYIAKLQIKLFTTNKLGYLVGLFLPIFMTLLFGFLEFTPPSDYKVGMYDFDNTEYSKGIIDNLSSIDGYEIIQANYNEILELVKNNKLQFAIGIKEGYKSSLENNRTPDIEIIQLVDTGEIGVFTPIIEAEVLKQRMYIDDMNFLHNNSNKKENNLSFSNYCNELTKSTKNAINYVLPDQSINDAFYEYSQQRQASLGYIAFFTFMTTINLFVVFIEERRRGMYKRLLVSGASRLQIFIGKNIAIFIYVVFQSIILICFGAFVMKVGWMQNIPIISALMVSYIVAILGISSLVTMFSKNTIQHYVISIFIVTCTSMLGGAYYPIDIMPSFMQKIANMIPQGLLMYSINRAIIGIIDYSLVGICLILLFIGFIGLGFSYLLMAIKDKRRYA